MGDNKTVSSERFERSKDGENVQFFSLDCLGDCVVLFSLDGC